MEPERRIEKLLRAFAKKRREQAGEPAALRPAARQRLQQEISRRSAAKSGGGFLANLFSTFQPRLAFALCSLAILVIGGWLLLPVLTGRKPPELAAANSLSAKTPSKEKVTTPPALAPPPATTPAIASDEDSRAAVAALKPAQPSEPPANAPTISSTLESSKQVNVAENGIAQTNSITGITVASAPSPARQAFKTESVAADSFSGASTVNKDVADRAVQPAGASVAMRPAPVAAPTLAESDQVKKLETQKQPSPPAATSAAFYNLAKVKATAEAEVASQRFNRTDAAADGKRALGLLSVPAPVLASFRLEQNGNDLRVVDADGSVYTGVMQAAQNESPAAAYSAPPKIKPSAPPPPVKTSPPSAAQNYYFTVVGTNRNLNQNVVFSGNLIPFTNALTLRSNAGAFGGALRTGRAAQAAPEPSLLSNSRISGKAVIGNEKEIEVNATPAP